MAGDLEARCSRRRSRDRDRLDPRLSRAIGETAPLILIGAVTYIAFDPTVLGPFTALPIQIYQWVRLPQAEFKSLAAAAIIVLLAILLTMNAFAIWLRNRYQKRW